MNNELKHSGMITEEEKKDKVFEGGEIVTFYFRGEYYDKKDENGETQFIKDLKKKNEN